MGLLSTEWQRNRIPNSKAPEFCCKRRFIVRQPNKERKQKLRLVSSSKGAETILKDEGKKGLFIFISFYLERLLLDNFEM